MHTRERNDALIVMTMKNVFWNMTLRCLLGNDQVLGTLENFYQNKRRHIQEGIVLFSGLRVLW